MTAPLAVSGFGWILIIAAMSVLFLAWVVSLLVLVMDTISVLAKIVWFVLLTVLAPIAIPVYFILRHRRRGSADGAPAMEGPRERAAGW